MSYAPSAPSEIWRITGISDGAKLIVVRLWGQVDHEVQRDPRPTTVWVPAATDPAGEKLPPGESLLVWLRENVHPEKSLRTIRGYLSEARRAGLADAEGRCVALYPPTWQDPATQRQDPAGEMLPVSGRIPPVGGEMLPVSGRIPPVQLNPSSPPKIPPSSPNHAREPELDLFGEPIAQERTKRELEEETEEEEISRWWSWFNEQRTAAWGRWHPDAPVRDLTLTDSRRRALRARLKGRGSIAEGLELATHVIGVISDWVDRDRGQLVPTRSGGTYDSMRRFDPGYWLKATNFDKHAETVRRPQEQRPTNGSRIKRIEYQPLARWDPEQDDPNAEANREGRS